MSIKGQLQKREINKFGFLRIKVSGEWYGSDKKGDVSVSEGDIVEFDAYTNDRNYATFKGASLKKVASAPAGKPVSQGPTASKDEYWAKKEANDAAKEPRISYYAAFERAVQFTSLAFTTGALSSLTKAKDTAKLDVLIAFVDEQTQRILTASYAQAAAVSETEETVEEESSEEESTSEEAGKWN